MKIFKKVYGYIERAVLFADGFKEFAFQTSSTFSTLEDKLDDFSNKPASYVFREGLKDFSGAVYDFCMNVQKNYSNLVDATNGFVNRNSPENYRDSISFFSEKYSGVSGGVSDISDILLGKRGWSWRERADSLESYLSQKSWGFREQVALKQLRKSLDNNYYLKKQRNLEYVRINELLDKYVM